MDKKKETMQVLVKLGGIFFFLAIAIFFSIKSPVFLKPKNISNILVQSAVLGIAAFGLTTVFAAGGDDVLKGGTDLSIANNMMVVTCIISVMLRDGFSIGVALVTALAAAVAIGAINGISVVWIKMIPLLATLAMMNILQGMEKLIIKEQVVGISHPFIKAVAKDEWLGIPVIIWMFVAAAIVMDFVLRYTKFGRWADAIGGNAQAALASGINVKLVTFLTYVIAGILAFLSGVVCSARLSSAVPGTGNVMLFDIMLASYLGAIFSPKFRPNIWGTFVSAILCGMLTTGFTQIGLNAYYVFGVKGILILLAVAITSSQKRKAG